jgi:hypothetical protein
MSDDLSDLYQQVILITASTRGIFTSWRGIIARRKATTRCAGTS